VPLPLPHESDTKQAAALAALRPNTMPDAVNEGRSSRDLLWLASALQRTREMPHVDLDAFERKLALLHGYLSPACKPFGDAVTPPPPPPSELTLAAPAGLVITQWYEASPSLCGATIEPTLTLLYVLATPPVPPADGAPSPPESPFVVGCVTLPRSAVLSASRLVQRMAGGNEATPLADALRALKKLLMPAGAADPEALESAPRPTDDDYDPMSSPQMRYKAAVEAVGDSSLAALANLFDPQTGAACTDEPLSAWLLMVLTLK